MRTLQPTTIQGKALEVNTIKEALNESYKKRDKTKKEIDGFVLNETLSDNEAQVYWNPISQKAMVVHRGTASIGDVFQDVAYGLTGYKGRRFKKAERVQKEAERLYGADNISSLGHSLGSLLASDVGHRSKEIINYNKPITPYNRRRAQEYNIKTSNDPFSWFYKSKHDDKDVTIPSSTINPVTEHSISQLEKLDQDRLIGGEGVLRDHTNVKNLKVAELKQRIKSHNRQMKTGHKIKQYGKLKKKELQQIVANLY